MKKQRIALGVQNCIVGQFEKNLDSTLAMVQAAVAKGANMVVFPEMNLTGYGTGDNISRLARPITPELTRPFQDKADASNISILVGLTEHRASGAIHASHLAFIPGQAPAIYRKIHLAPNEQDYLSAGSEPMVFQHSKTCFGIQLCYDSHFPELTLAMALKRMDVLIIPHASPRGNSQGKFDSWMRHLRARAFDNGIFVLALNQTGKNNSGLSFPGVALAIGPDGNLISNYLKEEEAILMVDLDPALMNHVRSHRMRYFLPHRRRDLFPFD